MLFQSFACTHTATTAIYTLSLHDALPIYKCRILVQNRERPLPKEKDSRDGRHRQHQEHFHRLLGDAPQRSKTGLDFPARSEEHTSELQSLTNLVCRPLLEKKNNYISLDPY